MVGDLDKVLLQRAEKFCCSHGVQLAPDLVQGMRWGDQHKLVERPLSRGLIDLVRHLVLEFLLLHLVQVVLRGDRVAGTRRAIHGLGWPVAAQVG